MIPAVEKLGGWPEVEDLLSLSGMELSPRNKKAWKQRGLPRNAITVLSAELASRKLKFTPSDFDVQKAA